MSPRDGLAVTLVSGLRDSGKSTVATILSGAATEDAPVLDGGGIDAGDAAWDLATHLMELADSGRHGEVIIELQSTDPTEIALVLEAAFGDRTGTGGPALRELVTVARVSDIRRLLFREGPWIATDDYDTSELLALQLEFATAIVLLGTRQCDGGELRATHDLLAALNPAAVVVTLSETVRLRRRRAPSATLASEVGRNMGWALQLSARGAADAIAGSIDIFVFRDPRPFHPARLAEAVESCLEPDDVGLIVRSRGFVRLASRSDRVGSWTSAGAVCAINATTMMSWDRHSPIGQEVVFVGQQLDHERIARGLRAALLGDSELIAGPAEWSGYADPFPRWEIEHGH